MKVLKSGNQRITLYYGMHILNGKPYDHQGIDLVKSPSSLDYIVAAETGKVTEVVKNIEGFKENSYGNYVVLEHSGGIKTLYGHMEKGSVTCNLGQIISKGDILGYMGKTRICFWKTFTFSSNIKWQNSRSTTLYK